MHGGYVCGYVLRLRARSSASHNGRATMPIQPHSCFSGSGMRINVVFLLDCYVLVVTSGDVEDWTLDSAGNCTKCTLPGPKSTADEERIQQDRQCDRATTTTRTPQQDQRQLAAAKSQDKPRGLPLSQVATVVWVASLFATMFSVCVCLHVLAGRFW
eukprot:6487809-Amphidinium_carterae.1